MERTSFQMSVGSKLSTPGITETKSTWIQSPTFVQTFRIRATSRSVRLRTRPLSLLYNTFRSEFSVFSPLIGLLTPPIRRNVDKELGSESLQVRLTPGTNIQRQSLNEKVIPTWSQYTNTVSFLKELKSLTSFGFLCGLTTVYLGTGQVTDKITLTCDPKKPLTQKRVITVLGAKIFHPSRNTMSKPISDKLLVIKCS